MKRTKIHTTKKLEKVVKKLIVNDQNADCGLLGKWNATIFYVDRKKCWLFTNGLTVYNVILTNIKASDLGAIEEIFKNTFYTQLIYDGIVIEFEYLDAIVGKLDFMKTDNDRRMTGFQNQRLYELDLWKDQFGSLDTMPIKELTSRMNSGIIHIGKSRRMEDYTDAIAEMKKRLAK
ncbi:hypothetical protein [uncultured Dokdonia sp.]|uniref:DUF6933 domain-containing protein n=1 Tax=uncultured Dokdonia sp. TaxID=575653 RepID=UPI0026366295|nr:hypothetical protein [uncultured Dokdonia sp.]